MPIAASLKTKRGERAATRNLVKSVVLAQGNIFIRELLRRKKLQIGATKEDFEANLLQAIDDSSLQLDDVTQWLDEVEGWGDQSVYLYHLPKPIATNAMWRSPDAVRAKLPAAHRKLWKAQSLLFPETWELTGISYADRTLTYTWHEEYSTLLRRPKKDRDEEIDGDLYRFRAYLVRPDRSVMRFVVRADKALAAVFMQIPAEGDAHKKALELIRSATESLIDWGKLSPFNASNTIKNLGQAKLQDKPSVADVKSRKTRLTTAEAYVEFGTRGDSGDFFDYEPVRDVRWAVEPRSFAGSNAIFGYAARTPTGLERHVTIEIYGEQCRIKLRAQLKASEVWSILDLLRTFERA